eukprot:s3515_g11.t1
MDRQVKCRVKGLQGSFADSTCQSGHDCQDIHDLASYGFRQKSDGGVVDVTHDWQEMCKGIQGYIKESLNQGMLDGFEANGIKYYNKASQTARDRHTIQLDDGQGGVETVTANYIMLAAGGRPNHGGYPGADEHCISSDASWP